MNNIRRRQLLYGALLVGLGWPVTLGLTVLDSPLFPFCGLLAAILLLKLTPSPLPCLLALALGCLLCLLMDRLRWNYDALRWAMSPGEWDGYEVNLTYGMTLLFYWVPLAVTGLIVGPLRALWKHLTGTAG